MINFFKQKKKIYVNHYKVDITKPPIEPPGRFFRTIWNGELETDESISNTKMWKQYIKEYGRQINDKKVI